MYTREQFLTSLRKLQDQFNANALASNESKLDLKDSQRQACEYRMAGEHTEEELNSEYAEHSKFFSIVSELALLNTVICMAIAHSRGTIHAKTLFSDKIGHELSIDSLEAQIFQINKFVNTFQNLFADLAHDLKVVATTPKEVKMLPPKEVTQPVEELVYA